MEKDQHQHNHEHKHEHGHQKGLSPPLIETSDINIQAGPVKIIVYKNCSSIYIEGDTTKIYFDLPSDQSINTESSSTNSDNHDDTTDHHTHEKGHSHHSDEDTNATAHSHTEDGEDTIDLSCEGVQILLCDCCSVLKVKGHSTDLIIPLEKFKKANVVLTSENGYYVRRYKIELWKHITNAADQKLFVNNIPIEFEYSPAQKNFKSHLFFREYKNIVDLMADYLKANPNLGEFKHHH